MKLRMIAVGLAVVVLLAGCGAPGPGANDTTPEGEESPDAAGQESPTEEDGLMATETTAENETAENETATGTETTTEDGMMGDE